MTYVNATIVGNDSKIQFLVPHIVAVQDHPGAELGCTIYTTDRDGEYRVNETYEEILSQLPRPE